MNIVENTYEQPIVDGRVAAQYFKYYSQYNNSNVVYPQQLNRVAYVTVYNKYRKQFDVLADSFIKNNQNVVDYLKWFVLNQRNGIKDIQSKLIDLYTIEQYFNSLKVKTHLKKVFKHFNKCCNSLADYCIEQKLFHCVDYIKKLINSKKLAQYYLTGRISKHFLAAIPKFPEIVAKLDHLSRDEFHQICSMYDTYHREVADAMKQELGKIYGPFSYVDKLISEKMSGNSII